jgi:heterotetrameric sarcosine oxidase gamma subunit
MSTLDFLSLERTVRDDRFAPVAKSPMQRRLADAGAEFEERDGRLVATFVPGQADLQIRVRDVTHAYRVVEAEGEAELRFGDGSYGVRPPTGRGRILVAYERGSGADDEFPADALDVSAAWAALEIEGPGAERVMRRLTQLDLDALPLVGALSHVRALVARPGGDRFLVVFPQEYGHYLWEVVVDAAAPLGGGPSA